MERGARQRVSRAEVPPSPGAARAVRVLIVDDQAVFRGIANDVIAATDGFEVAGEAGSGEQALESVKRLAPDLVLLDVRMPGMDGIEVARRLVESRADAVVVLISVDELADLPSTAELGRAVPLVRKQDFGPRMLRRLWTEQAAYS